MLKKKPLSFAKVAEPKTGYSVGIFFGFILLSGIFWLVSNIRSADGWFKAKVYEFSIESGSRTDEIVERSRSIESVDKLMEIIAEKTDETDGIYGWYAIEIETESGFGVNEDEIFTAASVIKVPIMVKYLLDVEADLEDLGQVYKLDKEDVLEGTGSLQYQEEGTSYSYEELLLLAGKQSDNTAIWVLMTAVRRSRVQQFVDELEMSRTDIAENESSPRDMARLFVDVYQDKIFFEKRSKELFFEALTDTDFEDRIPAGVPEEVRVIHKIGNETQVWNDCGIILSENPYVLCIMTGGIRLSESSEMLPFISEKVWQYMNR